MGIVLIYLLIVWHLVLCMCNSENRFSKTLQIVLHDIYKPVGGLYALNGLIKYISISRYSTHKTQSWTAVHRFLVFCTQLPKWKFLCTFLEICSFWRSLPRTLFVWYILLYYIIVRIHSFPMSYRTVPLDVYIYIYMQRYSLLKVYWYMGIIYDRKVWLCV